METKLLICSRCGSGHILDLLTVLATQRVSTAVLVDAGIELQHDGDGYEVDWDTGRSKGLQCADCDFSSSSIEHFV